jgi:hypothetical protein
MKRLLIAGTLILGTVLSAHADQQWVVRWYDTIRPHGHKRADAIGEAAVQHCNETVGEFSASTARAFKACMARQGYRFMSAHIRYVRGSGGTVTYNRDSPNPNVGWHNEGGFRVCHNDCDNPEAPGSGYTCKNVVFWGMNMRQCEKHNSL